MVCLMGAETPAGSGALSLTVSEQTQVTADDRQKQMLEELRAIRSILQQISETRPPGESKPTPSVRRVGLTGYSLGSVTAPLTLVEFSDLQCPFCKEFTSETFGKIKTNWIETGKLRYIVRDLPLEIHPMAISAAKAARCAADQDRFWDMRQALLANGAQLSKQHILDAALKLGLNEKSFAECAQSTAKDAAIQADIAEGARLGFRGTPTFVLGRQQDEESVEGMVIVGAQPYAVFEAALRRLFEQPR